MINNDSRKASFAIASASPSRTSSTLQYLFDLDSKYSKTHLSSSPKTKIQSSLNSENERILSVISDCSITDLLESSSQQDLKRKKLIQLHSIIKTFKQPFSGKVLSSLVSMIGINLFRPLPPSSNKNGNLILLEDDDDDNTSTYSSTWQHLQIVYDILLRLVLNYNPKILGKYINQPFLTNLLSLFHSEDPRERESLKNVYHKIYLRFTFHRWFMRKSMNRVLLHYVFDSDEMHYGISELLEIWGSIINGFTVPLKEEHKLFLMRVLIPLHKPKGMQIYHKQLSYCVNQFVDKEPTVGGVVIRGLLKYWPITNSQKEILLISEMEEILDNIDPGQYRNLALPLCTQITRCFNSWNSQVAERALCIWNNEQFLKMTYSTAEQVFPVVVEGIEDNLKWHWSPVVKQLTQNVKAMIQEMEPFLYENCMQKIQHKQVLARQEQLRRNQIWERLELEAAKNHFLPNNHLLCLSH